MTLRVVASAPADVDRWATALQEARVAMRERVASLKRGSKDAVTTQRLLAAIDQVRESIPGSLEKKKAIGVVNHRVVMLKRAKRHLDSGQERDALLIVLFVDSRMPIADLREQACALIALHGSERARSEICALFPGLTRVFD